MRDADVPKAKAFRVPSPARVKIEISERRPVSAKRELELLRQFVWCGSCKALLTSRAELCLRSSHRVGARR